MTNGYLQKDYGCSIKRYVQILELRDDPEMIENYRKLHSEASSWKEVREGIREVGILEMELYILGTKVVMIVDAPIDFDWQQAMDRLATLPRQAEWEATVSKMQGCDEHARSDEKWQMMERFFHLYR